MLSGTSAFSSSDHMHHHDHSFNNNPSHSNPVPTPASGSGSGLYSTDSPSMLSNLFPAIPALATLSSPHEMFRHSEFFRTNMAYQQDPSRQQQHTTSSRYLQRTDAT